MKPYLAIFVFIFYSFSVLSQTDVLSQKIDFVAEDIWLKEALFQLSHQTQIAFSAPGNLLPKKKINISFKEQPIETILQKLLEGSTVSFKFTDDQLIFFRQLSTPAYFTISGYIKEKESGERLSHATIIEKRHQKGISSNEYGFYSLTLPKGIIVLNYSYTGCETIAKKINLKKDITLNIELVSSVLLDEILVTSKDEEAFVRVSSTVNTLPIQQMRLLPSLGGEMDIIRTISLLSGVSTGPDGFGGIHIRGGSADQNLILLDGVPIYNPLHTGGIYSIFDAHVIQSAQLYKGNAPARFGGRLSSVLDVKMKEGNRNKTVGQLSVGLTTAKASIEGPIQKGKSSFIIALRKSLFNTYLQPISQRIKNKKGDIGSTKHDFLDFNSKINFSLGTNDQLYLSIYKGNDNFQDENISETEAIKFRRIQHDQDLNWGNTVTALRWNHLFNDKLFANTTLTYSKFNFRSTEFYQEDVISAAQGETNLSQENLFYSLYNSNIVHQAAKLDLTYIPSSTHAMRLGAEVIAPTFRPGAFTLDQSSSSQIDNVNNPDSITSYSNTIQSKEYSIYAEDKWNISSRLNMNIGLRTSMLAVEGVRYWSLQPRFSGNFKLSEKVVLQADVGKTYQSLHQLSTSSIGLPSDLWVSSTAKIAPQVAWQGSLGTTIFLSEGVSLEIGAYQKKMKRLIAYEEGANFLVESIVLNSTDWESKVNIGSGKSYGIEYSLKKETGRLRGWMNYTWSKSLRQFDALNGGKSYDFKFDRPHSFKIAGLYQLNPKWMLSANWTYQSGLPTTLPISEYTFYSSNLFTPTTILNIGQKNSFRLPAYHRLDIELTLQLGKITDQQVVKLGVYNIYNRKNPLYYRLKEKTDGSGEREFVQVSLLPILPSLNYTLRF